MLCPNESPLKPKASARAGAGAKLELELESGQRVLVGDTSRSTERKGFRGRNFSDWSVNQVGIFGLAENPWSTFKKRRVCPHVL